LKPEPEPAKIVPEPKPAPVKPKVVRAEAKKPTETPRRPGTPRHLGPNVQAPAASAISAGASAAVRASYNQLVAAHLQRFKEYPPGAKAAGEQGTARLASVLAAPVRCWAAGLRDRRGMRPSTERHWRWSAAPSHFPAFRRK